MARQLTDEEILAYKGKEATAVQERFADWLIEKLELEFPNAKAEAAFREAVRLATALRMIFQASTENQEARQESRAERAEAKAKPAKEPKPAKAAKATKAAEREQEPEAQPSDAGKAKGKGRAAKVTKAAKAVPAKADDAENDNDTAVAPATKATAPKKASARSGGKPAPF